MKKYILFLAIGLVIASPLALAQKIYKWVDKDGTVHYGSQPPGHNAQEVRIHQMPAAPAPEPAQKSGDKPPPSFMESYEKEQKDKAAAAAKAEQEKALRDKNCAIARKRLATLKIGGRIVEADANGERKFLSDEEIQSRQQEAQKDVDKWCQ
jgi:hypothetical protein